MTLCTNFENRLNISLIKGLFFLFLFLLLIPSLAQAGDSSISGYAETGKRSTAWDYEEEGTDEDYTLRNYHFKLEEKLTDRLQYDLSSFVYNKDYKSSDALDNTTHIFKTNWAYYLKKLKEESLKLDCKLQYRQKHYENVPKNEYERIRFAPYLEFEQKDVYRLEAGVGVDSFDYQHAEDKDLFKIFGELVAKRYFLEKKLALDAAYQIETAQKKRLDRKKTKQEIAAGVGYLFELPWLYKVNTGFAWGERDSKDDEERDEDYDYTYRQYSLATEQRVNEKLKTELKYRYFKKDYLGADLDHRGFYLENDWDYELFENEKARCWFDCGIGQKEVKYSQKQADDYQKQSANVKASYQRKKDWKVSSGVEVNFYDYGEESNDKARAYTIVSLEKLFLQGDLSVALDFKFRYIDYQYKNDEENEAVRIASKYRF